MSRILATMTSNFGVLVRNVLNIVYSVDGYVSARLRSEACLSISNRLCTIDGCELRSV